MNVAAVALGQLPGTDRPPGLAQPAAPGASAGIDGFGSTLRDAVSRVDGAQKTANSEIEAFIAGEQENLHEVMIAMNEAQLHFQLMTEVRNRALDTYQELMRMQV